MSLNNCINDVINNKNMWVGDTGASHHVMNSLEGMYNLRTCGDEEKVVVALLSNGSFDILKKLVDFF